MASLPDLMSLLCFDARLSQSPFGGRHRTILIQKDYTNTGDFVFNSLLQNFNRREPNTPVLIITLSQDWTNYSASAAKCGFNLRRAQNSGQFYLLDVMNKIFTAVKTGDVDFDPCNYIIEYTSEFIKQHSSDSQSEVPGARIIKPIVIMIDDISALLNFGCNINEIFRLFSLLDKSLRDRSKEIKEGLLSHLIIQSLITTTKSHSTPASGDFDLNYLVANIENLSDLSITLKPLDTGYSTRVDGTIKIVDNRIPLNAQKPLAPQPPTTVSLFPEKTVDIGVKKAYFFKVGDRRVRLTTSALIF